jgi:hypothetical protein
MDRPRGAGTASAVMFTVIALIAAKSRLWRLDPPHHGVQASNAATASSE